MMMGIGMAVVMMVIGDGDGDRTVVVDSDGDVDRTVVVSPLCLSLALYDMLGYLSHSAISLIWSMDVIQEI